MVLVLRIPVLELLFNFLLAFSISYFILVLVDAAKFKLPSTYQEMDLSSPPGGGECGQSEKNAYVIPEIAYIRFIVSTQFLFKF